MTLNSLGVVSFLLMNCCCGHFTTLRNIGHFVCVKRSLFSLSLFPLLLARLTSSRYNTYYTKLLSRAKWPIKCQENGTAKVSKCIVTITQTVVV